MRNLWTMVVSDLRQKATDGSVLAFAVVVPLALMFVMNLVFAGATDAELEPVTVAVSVPEDDQLGSVIPQVLDGLEMDEGLDVTVLEAGADEVPGLVDDGSAAMGVVVPEGFGAALVAGDGPQVRVTVGDGAGISGIVVRAVLEGTLTQLTAGTRAVSAAGELGVPPTQFGAVAQAVGQDAPRVEWAEGETASEQLGASESVVAGQTGLFLLFTVGFGMMALVIEREQGTLARLVSMPMRPWLVVLAKGLVSFLLGLASTTVLLLAGTSLFDDVDFGSPLAVGVLVVLTVAATTSIMFIIAKVARTSEQAGIAQAIVAVTLGMSGGAFFQVSSSGWVGQLLAINPVKSFTNGLGITAGGGGVADLGPTALTLGVFTVVCLAIALLVPGRKDML